MRLPLPRLPRQGKGGWRRAAAALRAALLFGCGGASRAAPSAPLPLLRPEKPGLSHHFASLFLYLAVHPIVVIRQRKTWRRKDGTFIYFEDNAGVIVNPKGEMKGSAITGPVAKECAWRSRARSALLHLYWLRFSRTLTVHTTHPNTRRRGDVAPYCQQRAQHPLRKERERR